MPNSIDQQVYSSEAVAVSVAATGAGLVSFRSRDSALRSMVLSPLLDYVPFICLAAVLGRLPGTTVYRNMKQYPEAYTYNGIVIVRVDAPIYFANISYIKDR